MAFAKSFYSLLPLLVIFLAIQPTLSNAQNPEEVINKICRSMEEFGFCNQTFHQNLRSPAATVADLAQITIEQASSNATNTHAFILNLLGETTEPALKNALTECENAYKIVGDSFQRALVSFNNKDYDGMRDAERDTPRAEASCTTTFNTPPNPVNPLDDRNRQMRILIAMAVVTASELTS